MDRDLSISLDLIRVIAAFTVLLAHFSYMGYTGTYTDFFHDYGHAGVVMFFVLSGYVIAFVCEQKHNSLRDYMFARFARLYSVLPFALLLTLILDYSGRLLDPEIYSGIPDSYPAVGAVINMLFLQQSSLFSLKYLSNGPLWSLAYEFWYYVIFGCFMYMRGFGRLIILGVLLLIVWPKILLLMPCWLTGVFVYHLHKRNLQKSPAYLCMAILAFAAYWILASDKELINWLASIPQAAGVNRSELGFSVYFLSDYLLAILFGTMIFSLKYASGIECLSQKRVRGMIRLAAGSSFSMYSYHVPIILFLSATGLFNTGNEFQSLLMLFATLCLIYTFSLFTEARVKQTRTFLEKIAAIASKPVVECIRQSRPDQV